MPCPTCLSSNQAEFLAEISLHFPGANNLTKPTVLVFPVVLVCLDCGASRFTTPENELGRLARKEETATGVAAKSNGRSEECTRAQLSNLTDAVRRLGSQRVNE